MVIRKKNQRAITADPMNIQRIINGYYEELCAHKSGNLDERNQFLERYSLSKFTHAELNLERSVSIEGIKSTSNNLPR